MVALHGDTARTLLREQHRMHADLMAYPSASMYDGALRAHPDVAARTLASVLRPDAEIDAPPLLFVDTAGRGWDEVQAEGEESRSNPGEAAAVVAWLCALLDAGLDPAGVAVITPYAAQAAAVRELAVARGVSPDVEVDTVDAFQGREKDAVLVTTVRANDRGELGFLKDLRRMNVAITRARRHLCVVGDAGTLARHPYFAGLIAQAEAVGGYRSAWAWSPLDDLTDL
jgi:superfamily I DNA and/or RNA helicase